MGDVAPIDANDVKGLIAASSVDGSTPVKVYADPTTHRLLVDGGGSGGGVQSVTGLNTDNADPANPIVKISVDGVTITGQGTPADPLVATASSVAAIITATNSGNDQDYNLAQSPTSSVFYVLMNNLSYTEDDAAFPFSVASTVLSFNSALPSDLANTQIKLICL